MLLSREGHKYITHEKHLTHCPYAAGNAQNVSLPLGSIPHISDNLSYLDDKPFKDEFLVYPQGYKKFVRLLPGHQITLWLVGSAQSH